MAWPDLIRLVGQARPSDDEEMARRLQEQFDKEEGGATAPAPTPAAAKTPFWKRK